MRESSRFLLVILMAGLSTERTLGQKPILNFRTRFAQETNALRRAQKMPKLGEAEFDEINRDIDAGNLTDGLAVLKEYRDEIHSCERDLDAKNVDTEKHPKGFRELELSLRQSLRRLDNLLVGLTTDDEAPFLQVRIDLDELDGHLIHELFPR